MICLRNLHLKFVFTIFDENPSLSVRTTLLVRSCTMSAPRSIHQPCHFTSSFWSFNRVSSTFLCLVDYLIFRKLMMNVQVRPRAAANGRRWLGNVKRSSNRSVQFFFLSSCHRRNSAKFLGFSLYSSFICSTVHSPRFRVSTEFSAGAINGRELWGADGEENDWTVHPFSEWLVSVFGNSIPYSVY